MQVALLSLHKNNKQLTVDRVSRSTKLLTSGFWIPVSGHMQVALLSFTERQFTTEHLTHFFWILLSFVSGQWLAVSVFR